MRRLGAAWALWIGTCLGGCGGSAANVDGSDGGTTDGSSPDGATNDGAAPGGNCPANLPTANAPCDAPGLACEYGGTGDHLLCSTIANCQPAAGGNQWFVTAPQAGCVASQAQNPIGCPPSFTTLPTGATCPREAVNGCVYTEGVCGCIPCMADGGASSTEWACEAWPAPPGCPEPRPRIGSPCTNEGQSCMYTSVCGVNDGEPALGCQNGRWVQQAFGADCAIRACGM
jgi:hypothetical protein